MSELNKTAVVNAMVVTLSKEFTFEGDTVSEIDLSPIQDLTTEDLTKAETVLSQTVEGYVPVPQVSLPYCLIVASIATKKPIEFFNKLPVPDGLRVKAKVMGFLNN